MRIAFFGGSFDPPHRGHLAIATAAIDRLHLDRVLFAPVGRQPLKPGTLGSSFAHRCAMVRLAIAGDPRMELSLLDAPQPDARPNYTIDTLRTLRGSLAAGDALYCLLGADSFLTLRQWSRAASLVLACELIVATRPGFDLGRLDDAMPAGLAPLQPIGEGPGLRTFTTRDASGRTATLHLLPGIDEDISATGIRTALAAGPLADGMLAPEVASYIQSHALYLPGPDREP